jgi:hypothetical protein
MFGVAEDKRNMRKWIIGGSFIFLEACTHVPQVPESLRPNLYSKIDDTRRNYSISASNSADKDIYCSAISYTVIWENPEIYMVQRRESKSIPSVFLAGTGWRGTGLSSNITVNGSGGSQVPPKLIIRDVELSDTGGTCHVATLDELCSVGGAEIESNELIQAAIRASGVSSCKELSERAAQITDLGVYFGTRHAILRQYFPNARSTAVASGTPQ